MRRILLVASALLGMALVTAACGSGSGSPASAPATAHHRPAVSTAAEPASSPRSLQSVNGTVTSVSGSRVTLSGGRTLTLGAKTRIIRLAPLGVTGLKPGQYVAVTAKRQSDGTLLASVVNVFPPAERGVGVGQRPMGGGNLMTNATIHSVKGDTFTVTFPGGGARVRVGAGASVNRMETGSASDIRAGDHISTFLSPQGAPVVVFVHG